LIAFVRRLASTCIIRSWSKSTRMAGSALSSPREIPFAAATGSLAWAFATLGVALVVYGAMVLGAVHAGAWFRGSAQSSRP